MNVPYEVVYKKSILQNGGGNIAPFSTGVSLIGRAIILSSVSIYYFTKLNILFEIVAIFEPKIERKMSFFAEYGRRFGEPPKSLNSNRSTINSENQEKIVGGFFLILKYRSGPNNL